MIKWVKESTNESLSKIEMMNATIVMDDDAIY